MTSTLTTAAKIAANIAPPVAHISLCSPPLNVIDIPMMDELSQALADIDARPDISVITLRSEGKAFSAGVDVAAHTPDKVEEMLTKFHGIVRSLVSTKKVTIAAVHGLCLGGGAELAMICDLVYTSDESEWAFPEIKLGCYPPVACTALAALVGQKKAAELILTGRSVTGREAAEIGLATRSVSARHLESSVQACVAQLLRLSPAALAVAKKACYAWDSMHFDKGLARAEKIYFEDLMKTEDAQEGLRAFMEKRAPKWTGR
ncbi:MAG TPA: enoyl-CoA hydratase/isomerase family protein [Candidatus Eisenbacteria bacterium]|nr:enoyl-CoA hydratase/isomerase family protein [Candidatus Eisenbacteria bacterium]